MPNKSLQKWMMYQGVSSVICAIKASVDFLNYKVFLWNFVMLFGMCFYFGLWAGFFEMAGADLYIEFKLWLKKNLKNEQQFWCKLSNKCYGNVGKLCVY